MRFATGRLADAKRHVDLRCGQRSFGRRHGAEDLGVELDLVKSDAIVDARIEVLLAHRVHLRLFPTPTEHEATRRLATGT